MIPLLVKELTDWHFNRIFGEILKKLNWEPETDRDKTHFSIANRYGFELKKNWDITKKVLLEDIETNNYLIIENALFSFIGIGNQEILAELIKKLNAKGNKIMAEVFLNSGQPELKNAARDWAINHGYSIKKGHGAAYVSWGGM